MYAEVLGTTTYGLNGHVIGVAVDIRRAAEALEIVGLPAASVKESKERVNSAIRNSGYRFPGNKVIVNLAPADLKKDSSGGLTFRLQSDFWRPTAVFRWIV